MSTFQPQFSTSVRQFRPSPVAEIFRLLSKPDIISFAGGMPAPETFDVESFCSGVELLRSNGSTLLQYGPIEGYGPLLGFIAQWTAPRMGRHLERDELLITSGSTQVCDLLGRAFLDRGDFVICEEPTFMGNALALHNLGARFITVPCDEEGMMTHLLTEKIETALATGARIPMIYTIPNFHNPLGCTMSLKRRQELVAIAQRYQMVILEDDPYGEIRFEGQHLPTLFSLDTAGCVVYAGSFSKVFAPGIRVGWAATSKSIRNTLLTLKSGTDSGTSLPAQALLWHCCNSGALEANLPSIIDNYRRKRDLMEEALQRHMPAGEISWQKPEGGFFYWMTLKNVTTEDLFKAAIERNVAFVKGSPFYPNGGGEQTFRLCYTFATPQQLEKGLASLGEAIQSLL